MAPWRAQLTSSLAANKHLAYSRYAQLATMRPDSTPAVRTVVFRGFLADDDDALTFVTDSRSRKVQEVAANPAAEVAWYFPESREQYRLRGNLAVVDARATDGALQEARLHAWGAMTDAGRSQFAWPDSGQPRSQDPDAWTQPTTGPEGPPLDTFCLLLLRVEEVDKVLLFTNERYLFRKRTGPDGLLDGWTEESVNP